MLLAADMSLVEAVRVPMEPALSDDVTVLVVMAAPVTCVVDDVEVLPVADDVIDSEEIRKLVSATVVAVEVVPVVEPVLSTVAAVVVVKLMLFVVIDDIASRSMCCNVTRLAYFFLNLRMLRCKNSCRRVV